LLPTPVVQRLPKYLSHVAELHRQGVVWVSSTDLADALGLTSSTVRQDLSHLDLCGVAKRGYEALELEKVLSRELGANRTQRTVIVGAGYVGRALARDPGLRENGFPPSGLFDADPEVVGTRVGRLVVRPMKELARLVRSRGVEVGIVAVPAAGAQDVADQLIAAGIRGLLNLSYAYIRAPAPICVTDARILSSLQELSYGIRMRRSTESESPGTRSA
jgi:redox-sensing transcriptional repressor